MAESFELTAFFCKALEILLGLLVGFLLLVFRARPAGIFARAALVLVLILPVVSCSNDGGETSTGGEYEIDRSFRRGPVSFRVAIDRNEITIAEHVNMLIEARAEQGYVAELPGFGEKLEQFGIVDYSTPAPELDEGGVVVTRRFYELEPFLSGEYRIPPMTLLFRAEGDTTFHNLESDTITVAVRSILPEDHAELEIKDIAGPVTFPSDYSRLIIIAGCVAVAACAFFIIWRRRDGKREAAPGLTAHEIAYMRLERLLSSDMLSDGRYKEFTTEISDILRHYIEDRFGLRAPERTTEEFLAEAGAGLPVASEYKEIISEFLIHCDLVKFAALEPSSDDVKRAFETCRDFIDATREREEVRSEAA